MDKAALNVVAGIVRRESRSLLHYVSESFPFTTSTQEAIGPSVQQMVDEEQTAVVKIAQLLAKKRHRLPAYLGPYPMSFTSINYVTWSHLLPLLVDYQKQSIVELDRDMVNIPDEELAAAVQDMTALKRRHLQVLSELAEKKPALN